jgi:hypothetical protein
VAEAVVRAFEKLRQSITELMEFPAEAALGELGELVGVSQACVNAVEELHRRVVLATHRSEVWALDGFRSPARWIAFHTGLPRSSAGRIHRHALAMEAMPHASAAATAGLLNGVHVDQMSRCQRRSPEHYTDEVDEAFTTLACSAELDGFATAVRAWHERLDAEAGPTDEVAAEQRSTFSLHETLDGWSHGTLELRPDDAAVVGAALDRQVANLLRLKRDGDPTLEHLDVTHLRAQALLDLCDGDLRRDTTQRRLPDRHRVTLVMRLDEHGNVEPVGPVPPASTCESDVTRMVIAATGEVLDVGRCQRSWPTPIANAVIQRDRHCTFPGCDTPPGRSDVHHCIPWEDGGPTAVTNGTLLCRGHHTFLHQHRWNVALDEHQRATFRRPDGSVHTVHTHRPQRE